MGFLSFSADQRYQPLFQAEARKPKKITQADEDEEKNQRAEDCPRLLVLPQQHLYNGLARPADYSMCAQE